VLTLSLAVVVAVALKVVGALLITALLIIPAATARRFCHTPELMAVTAAIIGGISTTGGLQAAYWLDTPTGPTIVCLATLLFALSTAAARISRLVSQTGSETSTRV
jgi:zinc transport system permease protein